MHNKYSKNEIIKIVTTSAKKYKQNLLNKNIMFIYKENNKISHIETIFKDYNFLHLTGLKYTKGAKEFFRDCIEQKISTNNIEVKSEVFTKLKLEILENVMGISKFAKKIGTYNYNKIELKVEKIVGNMQCSIGFSNVTQNNKILKYYYPRTLLQENFKKNVIDENKIIAIFIKDINEKAYNKITFLSKKISIDEILQENDTARKIDFENIDFTNLSESEKMRIFLKIYIQE